ncbi:50S ribosomal protein L7ae [Bacillus luteus]|uniref:50S ribosomal protein L7ae n=1 Tax=Alkalicoccus luteus TaxID=1237094 RepID=A0A969PLC3_9BACI|nr:50S ribosomal protein L7ae [Alkalicoccus luteus]
MTQKQLNLLGLMQRAGRLTTGEELVVKSVQSGKAAAVVLAEDAGDAVKKKVTDKCRYYNVPVVQAGSREDLGAAVGKEMRVTLAILDEGFAKAFLKLSEGQESS